MRQPEILNLVNPTYPKKQKSGARRSKPRHRKASGNPGPFALTLGAVNPHKGAHMAKKKKKSGARAHNKSKGHKHHKSGNPSTSVVKMSPGHLARLLGKGKGKKKKGVRHHGGSRNPQVFGYSRPIQIGGIFLSVAGGVTVVKLITPMLPVNWQATDGARFLSSAGVALVTGIAGKMLLPAPYGDAVIAGAGAQAISVGLNPVVKKILANTPLSGGLMGYRGNGMGDFVPAQFPEPNNPIYRKMYAAALNAAAGAAGPTATMVAGSSTSGAPSIGRYRGRFH